MDPSNTGSISAMNFALLLSSKAHKNDLSDYINRAQRCRSLTSVVTLQEYKNFRLFVKSIPAMEIGMSIYHDIEGKEIDRDGFVRIVKVCIFLILYHLLSIEVLLQR